ncbi:uncharacterized protein BO96DRAFT_439465 [Aspergillus niger CBS 101883]|uniref:Uncharacterized protein n=1 Tax=Aspergillus niger ATCC 13496 TaxID=1353008 RepID=A0A370BL01_ASPNG|nr:uncharacterized protein BO96DRAFT_439465 [Aspergillus niger CBS 101883]PYH50943.1 hypothetical protein BO96DRAFT_439465 [Aspergillus niger CBS 101883]RDH14042.1 hypothetical protein M747DRAFT_319872 [Aspergillus niger ATCC 13496]
MRQKSGILDSWVWGLPYAAITVDNILTAPWPVNETELACVLWSGRALVTLGPEMIWLNKRGQVRLAGVEQSYQIKTSDMNADTLKLTALATVMRSMTATGAGHGRWSSEAQTFLGNLPVKSLDVLMKARFIPRKGDRRERPEAMRARRKQTGQI